MPTDKHTASGEQPSGRKRKRGLLLVGGLLLAAGAAWFWQQREPSEPATRPLIATAEIGSIENTITSAGSLQPSRLVDVGAQVSGQLQKLYVEVGDLVEEGQLLAEIDARVQINRVEASRANIESQEAQLAARASALQLAKSNAARQERLMAADATSQLDYDTAMNNLANAESSLIQLEKQIEQSRASLSTEETQLDFTRIYAPMAGTVVSIEMTEGRTLNAAQQAPTILRIADLSVMTVETEVSEADIGRIKKGMDVYFTTLGSGERRWYGEVRQILPTPVVENNVVLYTALFDAENPDGLLLPEMTAQVYFVTSSADKVLTVPVGALTFRDEAAGGAMAARNRPGASKSPLIPAGGSIPPAGFETPFPALTGDSGRRLAMVSVVNDDGSTEEREVIVGVTSRIAAEVISGLKAGEQVVAGILQTDQAAPAQGNDRGGPPGGPPFMRGGFR